MKSLSDIILYGNLEQVRHALSNTSELDAIDHYGYTPLIQTAILNDEEKANLLLTVNPDVNLKDLTGRSALFWAIYNQNATLAKSLLDRGADPNVYHLGGEPVLVRPFLHQQNELKKLLIQYGASIRFAQDYIYAKLIGHRFQIVGSVDIVDTNGFFVEIDYEGFYLDLSLGLVANSLHDFISSFSARLLKRYQEPVHIISRAIHHASCLLDYDHYLKDVSHERPKLIPLLNKDPLVLPIAQTGHASAIVKCGDLFGIVDRAKDAGFSGHLPILKSHDSDALSMDLMLDLVYKPQATKQVYKKLIAELSLEPVAQLTMPTQRIGNCSWANTEAIISVLYTLLMASSASPAVNLEVVMEDSFELYDYWRAWDKERALQAVIDRFPGASPARKASIAALLAGVLFQNLSADNAEDVQWACKIIALLKSKDYQYILDSYIQYYVYNKPTQAGQNLMRLLKKYDQISV